MLLQTSGVVGSADAADAISVERAAHILLSFADAGLSKRKLGEFLGGMAAFNQAVLRALLRKLDFKGLSLVEALRSFLRIFRLPGEAQQIDR
jgi:Sec7-like guanine-nucleotide exchange factor